MLSSGCFAAACLQAITKGVLDPRLSWADTCTVRLRQSVELVHTLKTVKGLRLLVPPRTPRSSGYCRYMLYVYCYVLYVFTYGCKVVVGPGAQHCALLEVWVLGVGMSTFGAQTDVRRGTGALSSSGGPGTWLRHLQWQIRTGV
jgi:hypothetical protein